MVIKMFIVYSPRGRNKVGMSRVVPHLQVDPSKQVSEVDKPNLDRFKFDDEEFVIIDRKPQAFNPAIKQYESTMAPPQGKKLIVKAREIMSENVLTITKDRPISEAWDLMKTHEIHHLPVVDNGLLIGLCTSNSILFRSILSKDGGLEEIKNEIVEQVMVNRVLTTHGHTDIRKVAFMMSEYKLGCLPIMSETEQLIGIVTLSDIVKRLAEEPPIELYV